MPWVTSPFICDIFSVEVISQEKCPKLSNAPSAAKKNRGSTGKSALVPHKGIGAEIVIMCFPTTKMPIPKN